MPRPCKKRCVCKEPKHRCFQSQDSLNNEEILLTVDEYETIRLIDLENKTQEETSTQMEVARTTVQSIYNNARKKIADAIVNGKKLMITGGDYVVCSHSRFGCKNNCRKGFCHKQFENNKED